MSNSDDTIDLLGLLRTLWRGKLVVLGAVLLCMILGGLYAWRVAVPLYSANAVVMLDARENSGMGLSAILGGLSTDSSTVNTEVQVLRGRTLIGRVVDELDLTADPEFNGALQPEGLTTTLRRSIGLGSDPVVLPPEEQAAQERDATTSALLEQVAISNVPNSLVFQIAVTTESAAKSARIADTVARLYIDDQMRVRFEATETAITWLSGQVVELKRNIDEAEAAVREFRAATNVVDLETLGALDRQLKETRRRIELQTQQAADLRLRLERMASAADPMAKALASGDEALIRLASQAQAGEAEASQFEAGLARVTALARQDLARVEAQDGSLREAEQKLAADFETQSRDLVTLEQLVREAEANRLLYDQFQTQLKETLAQQGIQRPDSRILSQAVMPERPSAPRKSLILAMTLVLGTMIGTGIVLMREMMVNRVRTPQELEALTGRPVFAQVPKIDERSRKGVLGYLARNPASAAAEAIRNLRVSILLSSAEKAPQVIMITSSVPGEGKTTTTLALAQNMTMLGRKVLVIEGDVRLSPLSEYFDGIGKGKPGVAEVIEGKVPLSEAVQSIAGVGDLLSESKITINAADLFSSERFAGLIAQARGLYDLILIDTPPVLVVPDARIIAQQADAVIFAVHWDRTSTEQVRAAMHQLELVNVTPAGFVLTLVDPQGMRRYGYGGSYGAYASYGKNYYTSEGKQIS
ncbi:polysaccharide biosynthesis tyrosine autokinase [Rhodobacter sp. 24-YEA-8]|uniref:GumC family protein n=1 Tax=Rhodobacter sp. 24-YEA-8 TaxID=1884310 RepID=UPI000894AF41|nr:polysaccharide biosynthesis tyrosine autokinase [Rhodobacter sp. 24-YEA-8]SED91434.1 capsular exopolysaccharide family [Rhodobacter sp. 24-YEA-8]